MVVLENWIRFDVSCRHGNSQINPTINKSSCVSIDGKASPAPLPSFPMALSYYYCYLFVLLRKIFIRSVRGEI